MLVLAPYRLLTVALGIWALSVSVVLTRGKTERAAAPPPPPGDSFTAFESGQVRPLAISPNGQLLFAVNTPDNRLEIFRIQNNGLQHRTSVVVGLEPVAVAAISDSEVWVVNHLSDSVSIVEIQGNGNQARVRRTLLVGDEPRDIVFAGPNKRRAFITAAHRGQNIGFDPQFTTAGIGRADVWTFDADNLGAGLGGTPLAILSLFTDTPRALAVTPDGSRVYAAGFHTGNQTTTVSAFLVARTGDGMAPPLTDHNGNAAPGTGLVVKWDGTHWVDERGSVWDHAVKFSLPDKDVFAIDANANPPAPLAGGTGSFAQVGTVLFNMAVNPVSGKVYVSNLDSRNHVRFEGPGIFAGPGVQGHLAESRISVLDPSGTVTSRHLNKHIDYSTCCAALPNAENAKSLAFPTDMAVSSNGNTLYVAALGSSKVGIYSTAQLEADTFAPSTADQVTLTGGGPTGLVLDESRGRLYVLTRFDNSISIVNTATKTEVGHVAMFNPEPAAIVTGRRFLYDASFTSSHGDSACASCHVFGDLDSLAWDLGNPDGELLNNPGPFNNDPNQVVTVAGRPSTDFHPMKGPMTTQSLRGMANHGPMHWRGDRTGGNDEPTVQPDAGSFNEHLGFQKFNQKFVALLGRSAQIPAADMSAFADFLLRVTYPPNPNRNLDDSDTPDQADARDFFMNTDNSNFLAPAKKCDSCHTLNPSANSQFSVAAPGFFGSNGESSFVFESQLFKNPHLRNQYQKLGMFGFPEVPEFVNPGDHGHKGDQVRGFGYLHDGSVDTDFRFVSSLLFTKDPAILGPGSNPIGIPHDAAGDALRRKLESFMLAFPSNLKPIVGQQITLSPGSPASVGARITLLEQLATAGHCDLIAKESVGNRGFFYESGAFTPDKAGEVSISDAALRVRALKNNNSVTYTCVPPGSGVRIGIDRDLDGILDGDDTP